MPKTCFVIGPIGDAGTEVRANADDLIKYIIAPCPALAEFEYDPPIRADQLNEPGRITSQVIKLLMEADLVIADLTGNNPNVFYELSLRHALAKPVIHVALDGTPLSFDIRDNRTIFYTMHSRIAEFARNELAKQIRHVHGKDYKPMNPILETIGIVALERSADPQQKAVGELMRMIQGLVAEVGAIKDDVRDQRAAANDWPTLAELALVDQSRFLIRKGRKAEPAEVVLPAGWYTDQPRNVNLNAINTKPSKDKK
jgi:hypothetical protein